MSRPALQNVEDIYPLSPMQEGMLFEAVQRPTSLAHFEQFTFLLRGPLNAAALRRAWQLTLDRHASLRAQFLWQPKDKPLQVIRRTLELPWREEDWSGITAADQESRLDRFLAEDRTRLFDVARPPLMRIVLVRLTPDLHRLIWTFHHILVDAWSVSLVMGDAASFYESLAAGQEPAPQPAPKFREYIANLQARPLDEAERHFRLLLAGFDAPTPLTFERDEADAAGRPASHVVARSRIEGADFEPLKVFARANRITMGSLFLGAWGLVLSRYANSDDVVFGATASGRPAELRGVDQMVGLFMNTLPVRARLPREATVGSYLSGIQRQVAESTRFQTTPSVEVQCWSEVPAVTPLFRSLVVFGNYPLDEARRGRSGTLSLEEPRTWGWTTVPFELMVVPGASSLDIEARFDAGAFDPARIEALLGHLRATLSALAAGDASRQIDDVEVLPDAERQRLVTSLNGTAAPYPDNATIPSLFDAQVARTPDAAAYRCAGLSITYRDLARHANALAHLLVDRGVTPGSAVGICIEPSLELPVALLAVHKAGACYVPLDPSYPPARLEFIAQDSAPRVILTTRAHQDKIPGSHATIALDSPDGSPPPRDEAPAISVSPGDVAYITYTSGSTGRPKGVEGTHRGAINRFAWMWSFRPFAAGETTCWRTTLNFVDSVWEAFGPLLQGVTTVIFPPDVVRDPRSLLSAMKANRVTRLVVVPSLLEALLDATPDFRRRVPGLRLVVTSGEALSSSLARRFLTDAPGVELLNLYGSSEIAADATYHVVTEADTRLPRIPIGRPIANTQALILDDRRHAVPEGMPGILHIGGANVARGYHKRPDLTAERFIPSPFEALRSPLFKTGDLARLLPDGSIDYLGRADNQVKVRGFRIELGEIEHAILQHPGVAEAAVVARVSAGGPRLVAYVAASNGALDAAELRRHVRGRLPEFMVPASIVPLASLPRTPNGKLDRRALPEPESVAVPAPGADATPTDEVTARLVTLYREVLGRPGVAAHESFFDLGGHSLLAVKLMARIEDEFKKRVPLAALLAAPSPAGLAAVVRGDAAHDHTAPVVALRDRGTRTPFFCIHGMDGNILFLERLARHLSPDQPVYGVQAYGLDGRHAPETTCEAMAERYVNAIRSVQPVGPYRLGGYSLGGMIALEMAHRLAAAGEEIERLVLFDTRVPRVAAGRSLKGAMLDRLKWHFKRGPRAFVVTLWNGPVERNAWKVCKRLGLPMPRRLRPWPVRLACLNAYLTYMPRPWAGPITLLRAEHQEDEFSNLPALGWENFARGELDVRSLPCDHLDFFGGASAQIVARELEQVLGLCAPDCVAAG